MGLEREESMGKSVWIPFPTRSKFLEALRGGIKANRHRLDGGQSVEVPLMPGRYGGKWLVIIRPGDHQAFEVEGSLSDPTRFPQRIKVTALALDREGLHGRFSIGHDRESGVVSLKRD